MLLRPLRKFFSGEKDGQLPSPLSSEEKILLELESGLPVLEFRRKARELLLQDPKYINRVIMAARTYQNRLYRKYLTNNLNRLRTNLKFYPDKLEYFVELYLGERN